MRSPDEQQTLAEQIEIIETIPVHIADKIWMVLVAMDLVPAWELRFKRPSDPKYVSEVGDKLIEAGFQTSIHDMNHYDFEDREIRYAHDTETLQKLTTVMESPTLDHVALGHLYGFPETAIHAFSKGETGGVIPEEVWAQDYAKLARFVPSIHWKDEMKLVQGWAEAIKKEAPKLWEEYIAFCRQ